MCLISFQNLMTYVGTEYVLLTLCANRIYTAVMNISNPEIHTRETILMSLAIIFKNAYEMNFYANMWNLQFLLFNE